jgi:hypothetical protein
LGPLEQGSPTDLGLLRRCGTTKSWPSQLGGAGDDEERRQEEIGAAPGGGDWVERRQEEIGRSSDGPAVVLPAPVTVGARGLPRPPRDFFFFRIVPYSWKPEVFDPFRILGPMLEHLVPRVWGPFRPLGLHDPFSGLGASAKRNESGARAPPISIGAQLLMK